MTPHRPAKRPKLFQVDQQETKLRQRHTFRKRRHNLPVTYANSHGSCVNSAKSAYKVGQLLLGINSTYFLLGSHSLSITATDHRRCWHLHVHPTSNENAYDEQHHAAATEGNFPLENNSIKGRCDNRSMSNTVACYSAELDTPCCPSGWTMLKWDRS